MDGRGIGPQYDGDLFVGAARPFLQGGFLWHFNLTGNRRKNGVDDPRLEDRVAVRSGQKNAAKNEKRGTPAGKGRRRRRNESFA